MEFGDLIQLLAFSDCIFLKLLESFLETDPVQIAKWTQKQIHFKMDNGCKRIQFRTSNVVEFRGKGDYGQLD